MAKEKKKTVTRKGQSVPIPTSRTEAAALVEQIGRNVREIERVQAKLNQKIQRIAAAGERQVGSRVAETEAEIAALQAFSEDNKAELLPKGRKSFELATAEVGWRDTPPAVRITNPAEVLARLKKLKLRPFIRIVEEIDKEAMLKDQARARSVEGVSISGGETFFIRLAGDSTPLSKPKLKVPSLK